MIRKQLASGFLCLSTWFATASGAAGQSFEIASVKTTAPGTSGLSCSGGPGTENPTVWRCHNIPLGLVILRAFRFQDFEFDSRDSCCTGRFDFDVRMPAGTNRAQFDEMLRNLLRQRLGLALHFEQKQMPAFALTVAPKGLKLKQSAANAPVVSEQPWWASPALEFGKDGYPEFPLGRGGLANGNGGRYRWVAVSVSAQEIARTLADQLHRPVIDATQLNGRYDFDLKWVVDYSWNMSEKTRAEFTEQVGTAPEKAPGPLLPRALEAQLGLRLISKKGVGRLVVIDHVNKLPTDN